MRKFLIMFLLSCGLAGLPTVAGAGLFSATGPVVAILADDLFTGEAEGHLNGAGTLVIRSQSQPELSCLGQFTSSAKLGGKGQLQCSDGSTAAFTFKRINAFRGYGSASFSRGAMSFAYGFTPEAAIPYLTLPEGKKLARKGTELMLVNR